MNYKFIFIITFFISSGILNGQKPFKEEVFWSIWHPVTALKVKKMYSKVYAIYDQPNTKLALDNFNNGGKLDAFRHVFFMAAFSQKIKIKKIKKLGIAHEKGNYRQFKKHQNEEGERPDSLSNVMDLINNDVGLKIGLAYKDLSLEKLKELVIWKIKTGNAAIIKRNKQGLYVECDDKIIDMQLYKGKWFVPKCLVPSN
jgi:hypothetical protein